MRSVNVALLCYDLVMSETCISLSVYTTLFNDPTYPNPLPLVPHDYSSFCDSECKWYVLEMANFRLAKMRGLKRAIALFIVRFSYT